MGGGLPEPKPKPQPTPIPKPTPKPIPKPKPKPQPIPKPQLANTLKYIKIINIVIIINKVIAGTWYTENSIIGTGATRCCLR